MSYTGFPGVKREFKNEPQELGSLSGAEYLASIYGTEKDKVNCSFYFKIGACRHGDGCYRNHFRPTFSPTIILKNFYVNPIIDMRQADAFEKVGERNEEEQRYFDEFYEEVYTEMERKYGPVDELHVCENIGEHMVGNTYVKFAHEEDAEKAKIDLDNRWFGGQPIYAELSPVTDFRESRCRQHDLTGCNKGGFCNFMHLKHVSDHMMRRLQSNRRRWNGSARFENYRRDYHRGRHDDGYVRDRGGSSRRSYYRSSRDRSSSRDRRR